MDKGVGIRALHPYPPPTPTRATAGSARQARGVPAAAPSARRRGLKPLDGTRQEEAGCCGERRTSKVISLGAKTRNGGPQNPVPRLV